MTTAARSLALLALLVVAACSGGGGVAPHVGNAPLPMPSSVSPGSIVPAPMKQTALLPPSAMTSRRPAASLEPASWVAIPGAASQIAVGAAGTFYVLSDQPAGPDKYIWEYTNGSWTNIPGLASHIAATSNTLFAINSSGGIYRYDNSVWTAGAGGASAIAADTNGNMYVISNGPGTDRAIWFGNGFSGWTQVPGAGVALDGSSDYASYAVAGGTIAPTGVYVINSTGAIYYLNRDGSYALLPGAVTAIATNAVGGIFALGYPGSPSGEPIYHFDFPTQTWSAFPGQATSIAYSGSDNALYAISATGAIYRTPVAVATAVDGVRIGTDPFSNPSAQHATEVEPSAFAVGSTVVAAYQAGRLQTGGASGTGVATSFDGGHSWTAQPLPGITTAENPANVYSFGSDPVVTYDQKHALWLVTSMAVVVTGNTGPAFVVSRSHDGVSWSAPLSGPTVNGPDKPWIGCDNTASSPHYGNCYAGWENGFGDGVMCLSTTTDAGATWSTPVPIATNGFSTGVVPTVRPDGTVVAPYFNEATDRISATSSSDGGATWAAPSIIGTTADTYVDQSVRSLYAPSVATDATGTIYTSWEPSDATGAIFFSKTTDGIHWSTPLRIPVASGEANKPRLIVSLGADPSASGHLGITYYVKETGCSVCSVSVYIVASDDGGASWSAPTFLAGPILPDSLARAIAFSGGGVIGMLGDYDATVFSGGSFVSIFASATPLQNGVFDEADLCEYDIVLSHERSSSHARDGGATVANAAFDAAVPTRTAAGLMTATLRFNDVVKTYGARTVVDQVTLAVAAGEIAGLVGVNGSGKSTLFRIASGFISATCGSVTMVAPEGGTISLLGRPASDRVGLGMCAIAQDRRRMHSLSTIDCLRIAHNAHTGTSSDPIIFDALKTLRLSHLLQKQPSGMSPSDATRLLLAQAYLAEPRFLLADEPFAGLDGRDIADCADILGIIRERGTGILLTDHHPGAVLGIADRVHIMLDGAIVYSDTAQAARTSADAAMLYFRRRA